VVRSLVRMPDPNAGEPTAAPGLAVRDAGSRGRGVFATRAFAAGAVLERAPVLVIPRRDCAPLRGSLLDSYWFWWDDAHNAAALGCGSLYNHACPANARFDRDPVARTLVFTAVRPIAPGDEITINYHGEPHDPDPVWFPVL
jgi:SET domain-containing protein